MEDLYLRPCGIGKHDVLELNVALNPRWDMMPWFRHPWFSSQQPEHSCTRAPALHQVRKAVEELTEPLLQLTLIQHCSNQDFLVHSMHNTIRAIGKQDGLYRHIHQKCGHDHVVDSGRDGRLYFEYILMPQPLLEPKCLVPLSPEAHNRTYVRQRLHSRGIGLSQCLLHSLRVVMHVTAINFVAQCYQRNDAARQETQAIVSVNHEACNAANSRDSFDAEPENPCEVIGDGLSI
mmetsp:Transcript_735/g.2775  ORF Transcript_735/g.2775 Transcript_735/m.2775 type:complete len:234 (+) Transcript_735:1980-2681(+)